MIKEEIGQAERGKGPIKKKKFLCNYNFKSSVRVNIESFVSVPISLLEEWFWTTFVILEVLLPFINYKRYMKLL